MATDDDWASYDRAVVDLTAPGGRRLRLVPDAPGVVGRWPGGASAPVVVVTAWNPDSVVRPAGENRAANDALAAELDTRGLTRWPATGRDPDDGHHEDGFAVQGLDVDGGTALGRRHGQAAVYVWTPEAWEVVSCTDGRRHVHGWRLEPADGSG
jgi:hypothetical protein